MRANPLRWLNGSCGLLLLSVLLTRELAALLPTPADAESVLPTVGSIERFDSRLDALIPPGAVLERVVEGRSWTEGPVWSPQDGWLLFSDVPRNGIFRWREGAGVSEFLRNSGYSGSAPFSGREPGSNGLAFDPAGRLVICQHGDRRVVRRETDGTLTVLADRYDGKRLNSPNDLALGSNGALYFTDPVFGLPGRRADPGKELDFQGVYRLANGKLMLLTRALHAPNGIALSPDERTLYVSNAASEQPIWMAYPLSPDGTIGTGRVFADAAAWVKTDPGLPDGLKVDRQGNVFATGPGGVHVFAPDGTRLGRIRTGVPTGNVNWGEDGSVLFIAANQWILRLRTATTGSLGAADR